MNTRIGTRKSKVIVSVALSLMMAFAMMPGMAFAASAASTADVAATVVEDSITINPLTKTVYVGDEITMSASVNTEVDPYHVEWSSSDKNVATISKKHAKLVGLNAGTTTITAKLLSGTDTEENPTLLAMATMDVTVVETEAYGFQGTGGQTMKLTKPASVTVNEIQKDATGKITKYVNSITGKIAPEDGVYSFGFTMSAGMNTFSPDSFVANSLPHIKILNADGSVAVEQLTYGGYDAASKTITLNVPTNKLNTNTSYVLEFGADVQGNNPEKTLGVPITFTFITKK